jgi:hypothetical protein
MNKKYLFVLLLAIGLVIIIPSFVYFSIEDKIIDVLAIYLSGLTAVFAIFVESASIKDQKQEIYGQLKSTILYIISVLERRNYEILDFSLWRGMRTDDRCHLLDEELREKLDDFLGKTNQYSDTISKLDWKIIPDIIDDAVLSVFGVNSSSYGNLSINIIFNLKKKPSVRRSVTELKYYLKTQQSLADIINHKAIVNNIEEDEIESYNLSVPFSSGEVTDFDKIASFWNECLNKLKSVAEFQHVVEENDILLKEAEEIKDELIKRIEKTIES